MNLTVNFIPSNWEPGNHKAITAWMGKLPEVKDFKTINKIDKNYDQIRASKSI